MASNNKKLDEYTLTRLLIEPVQVVKQWYSLKFITKQMTGVYPKIFTFFVCLFFSCCIGKSEEFACLSTN